MGSPAKKLDLNVEKTVKKKSSRKSAVNRKLAKKVVAKTGPTKIKSAKIKPAKKLTKKQREAIIVEHRDHGRRLAWSFLTSWRMRLPQDEVVSVVGAALCEAAIRFDPSREVAFKTFFFYHLRGMLLKEVSRMIKNQKILQLVPTTATNETAREDQVATSAMNYSLVDTNNPEKIALKRQIASACWDACSMLDTLEQEVLLRFFVHDEPLIKIAKSLNYCRCHISRVKSRALKKMSKMLKTNSPNPENQDYTGGRGRRKESDLPEESPTLTALRANAY